MLISTNGNKVAFLKLLFETRNEEVLARALQDAPASRYPSMADLLDDLQMKQAKAKEAYKRQRRLL